MTVGRRCAAHLELREPDLNPIGLAATSAIVVGAHHCGVDVRAAVLRELGGPDVLRVEELPDPEPGPGEVVVELRHAALNFHDVLLRRDGLGMALPLVMGIDGAGVRRDTGEEVVIQPSLDWGLDPAAPGPGWHILGDRAQGTYAEFVAVPAANLYPKPPGWAWEEAAALPTAGLTTYRALFTRARLQPGETVLVLGAGGGIATFVVALAVASGARALVTSSTETKIARAVDNGAEGGVLYTRPNWPEQLLEMTGGGVDVVVDAVGRDAEASLRCLRPGGRLVVFGAAVGSTVSLDLRRFFFGQRSVLGTTLGHGLEFEALLDLVSRGSWRPRIDSTYPLAEVAEAHRRMESGQHFGKIVLTLD